jgi:hypothetical protein
LPQVDDPPIGPVQTGQIEPIDQGFARIAKIPVRIPVTEGIKHASSTHLQLQLHIGDRNRGRHTMLIGLQLWPIAAVRA